jgi:hypothetical protein
MAEEFPLPSSSYKELIKIIRAYGRLETEANLADVAKLAVMAGTTISGNNDWNKSVSSIPRQRCECSRQKAESARTTFCTCPRCRTWVRARLTLTLDSVFQTTVHS